jgi:hypothetical protein
MLDARLAQVPSACAGRLPAIRKINRSSFLVTSLAEHNVKSPIVFGGLPTPVTHS